MSILQATPATLAAVLPKARAGDTIALSGDFAATTIKARSALIFDAAQASVTNWIFTGCAGIAFKGGIAQPKANQTVKGVMWTPALTFTDCSDVALRGMKFLGPEASAPGQTCVGADGTGVQVTRGKGVTVSGCDFRGLARGVILAFTDGFEVSGNSFYRLRVDGIDIGQSWRGKVTSNAFHATRVDTTEHPDAIQGWSRSDTAPTSDVEISDNVIIGDTQGIFFGNHQRPDATGKLVDDGGFDRITVRDNQVWVSAPQAIGVADVRGLTLTGNRIRTLAGAAYRASLNVNGCSDVSRSGNVAEAGAGKPAIVDPL